MFCREGKVHYPADSLFCCLTQGLVVWLILLLLLSLFLLFLLLLLFLLVISNWFVTVNSCFHRNQFPQFSRTLQRILTDFSRAVVFTVSILFLVFNSPNLFSGSLVPATNYITVTFMLNYFFSFLAVFWYLSLFSLSFLCTLLSDGTEKFTRWQVFFFFLSIDTTSSLLTWANGSVCILEFFFWGGVSQWNWCVSFFGRNSGLSLDHWSGRSNFNLGNNSQ